MQTELVWHEPAANHAKFAGLLGPLAGRTDLVVLPEMFTTGFTMDAHAVAEPHEGPTLEWMRRMAGDLSAVVMGSYVVRDGGASYNRLVWMRPDGSYETYDKRHLFRMAAEHQHYTAGVRRVVVELEGWRICPLVCYDLRFPVWSRNRIGTDGGYDLLVYVANWPARRRYAWQVLLKARAIENLSYCVGVNRVGKDGKGIEYAGDSAALDYLGQPLSADLQGETVCTATLERRPLDDFRAKFPAHLDADEFQIVT